MFGCFKSYRGMLLLTAAAALGLYLVIWHGQHVAAALPFLVLAACPLMHLFGHGHHHGHHQGHGEMRDSANQDKPKATE